MAKLLMCGGQLDTFPQDTSVGVCLRSLTSHSQPVMQIRWSGERPDIGGVVYSAGRDCVIKVWNPKDGAMLSPGGCWSRGRNRVSHGIGGKMMKNDLACQIAGSSGILHKKLQAIRYADETDATLLDPFCWISKPMKGNKMKQALEVERNGVVLLNHDCRTLKQWIGLRQNLQ